MLSIVDRYKLDHAELFTTAHQTSVSTERVGHFFDEIRMQLSFLLNKKHALFETHNTIIHDGVEVRSYFGFIRLNNDDVVEDRDTTIPIIREMDDDYFSEPDNFDTQLYLKVNMCVVSTVSPCDRTVTQLLHNKPTTDELTANIALAEMDFIHFAPLILQ